MKKISQERIRYYLQSTEKDLSKPDGRYASFDYCFNYFHSFPNQKYLADPKNIQTSCLHLAFFLASWGMLRGSSFLLQKSIRYYIPLIKYISEAPDDIWKIDVGDYSQENIEKLIDCGKEIVKRLEGNGKEKNKASQTLVTKIMMGVFGIVPAFDGYFCKGSGLNTFNEKSLIEISEFYRDHKSLIRRETEKRTTYDFETDEHGARGKRYTQAKIIDMIFFAKGLKNK